MKKRFLRVAEGRQHWTDVQIPLWVPEAAGCPSWGLSGAKPAWLSGGTPPAKAPVDGEGKSANCGGWLEDGVTKPCGEATDL